MAKAGAQVILISGYDGGTGAAPRSSIHHAGMPWELGLAETHQTLIQNGLRGRVRIETDGKLMTGEDVAIAAMLGRRGVRFCHSAAGNHGLCDDACLQSGYLSGGRGNPESGASQTIPRQAEYVMNFMKFIAQDLREYMARLGVRTVDELVGRTDLLKMKEDLKGRAASIDLSAILNNPYAGRGQKVTFDPKQVYNFELEKTLDQKVLFKKLLPALESGSRRSIELDVSNTDRAFGTMFGSEITKRYPEGLEEDTFTVKCKAPEDRASGPSSPRD